MLETSNFFPSRRKVSNTSKLKNLKSLLIVITCLSFLWIGGSLGASVGTQTHTKNFQDFEWLQLDPNSLPLSYCIMDSRAISGFEYLVEVKQKGTTPIICASVIKNEKRYVLQGSKLKKAFLSYKISKYPKRTAILGGKANIDREIRRAFDEWETATDLTFSKKPADENVDIKISFVSGHHGENALCDGSNHNSLAHAFIPSYGSEIHFNDAIRWTIGSSAGINLFQIAVHEVGHSLGLGHYKKLDSVMYPFAREYLPDFTLHSDDITAIQILYGSKDKPKKERFFLQPWKTVTLQHFISLCIIIVAVLATIIYRQHVE